MHTISVQHTIDAGHRVVGHKALDGSPGKCARLHGHTYGFEVELVGDHLDETGFVVDFGRVKAALDEWDHRMLLWEQDPIGDLLTFADGLVHLPFNPTAEHMASYLALRFLIDLQVSIARVVVRETPKSSATFTANSLDADTIILPHWPVQDETTR